MNTRGLCKELKLLRNYNRKIRSRYQLVIILAAIVSSLSFHATCFADSESNAEKDELEIALEKRKVLRERLKLANDEFESIKTSISKPSGSAAEQIEIQYKLKKMQRDISALAQELKDNASDIEKEKRFKDLWTLWSAAVVKSQNDFAFNQDKFMQTNKDKIIQLIFDRAVPRNFYDQSVFFNPQLVVDTVPSKIIDEPSRVLLLSMQASEKRKLTLSMLVNTAKRVVNLYSDFKRATNEKDKERAYQGLVDLAGKIAVDEVINHNR
jgi:hypothetical protein